MKMALFQPLKDIHTHYESIAHELGRGQRGAMSLSHWGIDVGNTEQIAQIEREREALRYLTGLNLNTSFRRDTLRPEMKDLESAFNRHLKYLGRRFNCHQANWQKQPNTQVKREYEACRHYLSQLARPEWVEALPERILCFASKYPDYDYENNRHPNKGADPNANAFF